MPKSFDHYKSIIKKDYLTVAQAIAEGKLDIVKAALNANNINTAICSGDVNLHFSSIYHAIYLGQVEVVKWILDVLPVNLTSIHISLSFLGFTLTCYKASDSVSQGPQYRQILCHLLKKQEVSLTHESVTKYFTQHKIKQEDDPKIHLLEKLFDECGDSEKETKAEIANSIALLYQKLNQQNKADEWFERAGSYDEKFGILHQVEKNLIPQKKFSEAIDLLERKYVHLSINYQKKAIKLLLKFASPNPLELNTADGLVETQTKSKDALNRLNSSIKIPEIDEIFQQADRRVNPDSDLKNPPREMQFIMKLANEALQDSDESFAYLNSIPYDCKLDLGIIAGYFLLQSKKIGDLLRLQLQKKVDELITYVEALETLYGLNNKPINAAQAIVLLSKVKNLPSDVVNKYIFFAYCHLFADIHHSDEQHDLIEKIVALHKKMMPKDGYIYYLREDIFNYLLNLLVRTTNETDQLMLLSRAEAQYLNEKKREVPDKRFFENAQQGLEFLAKSQKDKPKLYAAIKWFHVRLNNYDATAESLEKKLKDYQEVYALGNESAAIIVADTAVQFGKYLSLAIDFYGKALNYLVSKNGAKYLTVFEKVKNMQSLVLSKADRARLAEIISKHELINLRTKQTLILQTHKAKQLSYAAGSTDKHELSHGDYLPAVADLMNYYQAFSLIRRGSVRRKIYLCTKVLLLTLDSKFTAEYLNLSLDAVDKYKQQATEFLDIYLTYPAYKKFAAWCRILVSTERAKKTILLNPDALMLKQGLADGFMDDIKHAMNELKASEETIQNKLAEDVVTISLEEQVIGDMLPLIEQTKKETQFQNIIPDVVVSAPQVLVVASSASVDLLSNDLLQSIDFFTEKQAVDMPLPVTSERDKFEDSPYLQLGRNIEPTISSIVSPSIAALPVTAMVAPVSVPMTSVLPTDSIVKLSPLDGLVLFSHHSSAASLVLASVKSKVIKPIKLKTDSAAKKVLVFS